MYPIFSLLRRLAVTHIYATVPMLRPVDGAFHIGIDKPADYLSLGENRWVGPVSSVPITSVCVNSASSEAAAISLAKLENEVAEKARASNALYTFVSGPEGEDATPEGVRRWSRYACIRGVYRASSTGSVEQVGAPTTRVQFRRLPPGTVRLS